MTPSPENSPALEALLQDLKRAREAKGLSLVDIADATLINVQFLENIERGNTTFLPQTYVRAFIREYANLVGLDPAGTMKRYDDAMGVPAPVLPPPPPDQPLEAATDEGESTPKAPLRENLTRIIATGLVLLVFGIVLWNVVGREKPRTQEVPFSSVVQENEKLAAPARPESTVTVAPPVPAADSLVLRAQTTDTVWVKLVVDDLDAREYLFRPNQRVTWKAARRFTITAGNAGALSLFLDGNALGPLGKKGSSVRNFEITRSLLKAR